MNLKLLLILFSASLLAGTAWGRNEVPSPDPAGDIAENLAASDTGFDPGTALMHDRADAAYMAEIARMDTLPVYKEHWDTTQVFAYKSVQLSDLPPLLELNLIRDLSEFTPPLIGNVFSKYGPRGRRDHNGVDIPAKLGDPIYATFEGKVRYAKFNTGGFGNLVIIRHPNGLETWSAHLHKMEVKVGDYVATGQLIGLAGRTGRAYGVHLHFELRYCDQTFDPEFVIDFPTGSLKYQTFALEKAYFNIRSRASELLEEDEGYDFQLLAAGDSDTTSSVDILERIALAQKASSNNTASESQGNPIYHTIVSGDMLGKLAIKYGVSIDQICRLNGITRTTILSLGRKLRVK